MNVDLEQFYNEDPRRRHSEELEFGRDWTIHGARCEVSWVEATGEVYAMVEPTAQYWADGVGGTHKGSMESSDLVVELIGVVPDRAAIASVMSGWEQAMPTDESLEWVRERVANAASELGDPPAAPSDDMPSH